MFDCAQLIVVARLGLAIRVAHRKETSDALSSLPKSEPSLTHNSGPQAFLRRRVIGNDLARDMQKIGYGSVRFATSDRLGAIENEPFIVTGFFSII